MTQKIFVGLSGGVDSAVSAALLQEQGHDVVGVFIKIWQPEFIECTWKEDRLDAMRVCAGLGIPFREVDLSDEYKREVVERMVSDYCSGITPNPDVLCNAHIKFGSFAKWAKEEGAERIATGHYAQIEQSQDNILTWKLLRAHDTSKDQSYFLYRLGQQDLARALFPVGGMLKTEVRALAQKFNLPVSRKPDSQGLCFVGEVSMADFLKRFIPVVRGPVVCEGQIVGEHEGAALYTVGQRHGFSATGADHPYYVVKIDISTNTLSVSPHREDAAQAKVELHDVHWVYREPMLPHTLLAQARYHEQPIAVTLGRQEGKLFVTFEKPHIVSPGQSLVLYEGDVCLGGGIIKR